MEYKDQEVHKALMVDHKDPLALMDYKDQEVMMARMDYKEYKDQEVMMALMA
jgi:hypothetical protein